jgi:hypothetical protein
MPNNPRPLLENCDSGSDFLHLLHCFIFSGFFSEAFCDTECECTVIFDRCEFKLS